MKFLTYFSNSALLNPMILNIYYFLLVSICVVFYMPILCTKQIADKERKIREELKKVESMEFESFPQ